MKFGTEICLCFTLITGIFCNPVKEPRIFGGTNSRISDFPYMVSLRSTNTNQLICGGSIISKYNVLTAAHCLTLLNLAYHSIRIYTGTASSVSIYGNSYAIDYVVYHPSFERLSTSSYIPHDIAIIKVLTEIVFNEFQNKIALPTRAPFNDNVALISGWGVVENQYGHFISPTLRKATVFVLDYATCSALIPIRLGQNQFCTYRSYGVGICTGDAGGPVTSNGELYGIITHSFQCAQGLPDIHTQVYWYLDFIRANLVE